MSDKMKDICYGCGKIQDYGSMRDINDIDFDILCDKCFKDFKMSRANEIYRNVLDAMQDADKILGVEDPREYQALMAKIITSATKRLRGLQETEEV